MDMLEIEEKLRQHGFTQKEIAMLSEVSEKNNMTFISTLINLKKNFIKTCLLFLFLYSWFLLKNLSGNNPPDLLLLIVMGASVFIIMCLFAPLKTEFKAFVFLLKNRNLSHYRPDDDGCLPEQQGKINTPCVKEIESESVIINESAMEEKLHQHGFTQKEIKLLRTIAVRDKVTYLSLLIDLKGRFIRACFLLLFLYSWLLLETLLSNDPSDRSSLIVVAVVAFVALYIFVPFKLALKAFTFLLKNRESS